MATGGATSQNDGGRPAVGVLFTARSTLSREGEMLAKYVGLCAAAGGLCSRVAVVGVASGASTAQEQAKSAARRSDGVVISPERLPTGIYKETEDLSALDGCALWVLVVDAGDTLEVAEKLNKRFKKKEGDKKRVVLSLQTSFRRLAQLSQALPDDIVLHGGVGFQVVSDKDGVLCQLSQGCYFVERLAQEKVAALFAIDILESTGIQALSRRNVQALKWGTSMLRTFYYINALTGESVQGGLRDRNIRLLYLQTLVEISELLNLVMASNAARAAQEDGKKQSGSAEWAPDPIAATYLPLHSVMVLLPLPNWIFNTLIMRIFDFGLADSSFQGQAVPTEDFVAGLTTSVEDEFRDMFELAEGRNISLPTLRWLHTTLAGAVSKAAEQKKEGSQPLTIRGDVLRAQVQISRESTAASRTFFFKLSITVLLTVLLITFLLR